MLPKLGSAALLAYIVIGLLGAVSGNCGFPANYQNRVWFLMFSYNSNTSWNYRLFQPDVIVDNQYDNNSNFRIPYPCQDLYLINQSVLYYLTSNKYCAKLVITDGNSAVLIQEVDVSTYTLTNASQCVPLLNESCLVTGRCSALWMPIVNQLTAPPQFSASIPCPFQGVYQLSVDYWDIRGLCLADGQSTADASGTSIRFNVCDQNGLRNTKFKQGVNLLAQSTVCMAQLPGDAVNTDETGYKVFLLRYQTSLFCARYKTDASGNILLAINVKNVTSAYCGPGMSNAMPGWLPNNTILLRLGQLPNTTSTPVTTTIPISIPTTSTTASSTSATPSTATVVPPTPPTSFPTAVSSPGAASTTTTTTTSTATTSSTPTSTTTTTTSVATSSSTASSSTSSASTTASSTSTTASSTSGIMSSSTTVTASTSTSSASGISTSTTPNPSNLVSSSQDLLATATVATSFIALTSTAAGSSGGPSGFSDTPVNLNSSDGNCPAAGACGKGAVCNQTSGSCQCRTAFYRYSVADSRCVQDDDAIDDAYLKVVVPIIVVSTLGSIVAGIVLCVTAGPLSAGAGAGTGAATLVPVTKTVTLQPPLERIRGADPVYVTYGRNRETYANIESLDDGLVTYGNGTPPMPPDKNYALVRSSIPPKM